jgi:CheY-like chemotaxis protein
VVSGALLTAQPTALLVEDDPLNLMLIEQWTHMVGMQVIPAQTGREALGELSRHAPTIVVTDMHLPDMRADTLMAEIRRLETEQGRPAVPVLLLTGSSPEDIDPAFVAQCAQVLYKPVLFEQFAEAVARYCGPPAS